MTTLCGHLYFYCNATHFTQIKDDDGDSICAPKQAFALLLLIYRRYMSRPVIGFK